LGWTEQADEWPGEPTVALNELAELAEPAEVAQPCVDGQDDLVGAGAFDVGQDEMSDAA
jgi:hypothetical protein